MDEGFITLAVKSNIMHCYFDIEKSYDEMFEKAGLDPLKIKVIFDKYISGTTHYDPISLNGYTFVGPCYKFKNINYIDLVNDLFKIAKDKIILMVQVYNNFFICEYNKKHIKEYNIYLYELYSYLKNKYPKPYIELNEKFLGIKHNKDDKFFILYLNQYKENFKGFILAIRGDVNSNKIEKQLIDDEDLWKYENGNRIFKYDDFIEKAINNKPPIVIESLASLTKQNKIFSKIVYPKNVNYNCEDFFVSLKTVDNLIENKHRQVLKIIKSDNEIICDSSYEKEILEKLDKCNCVKKIKTQSLEIKYNRKSKNKEKKYIPDIQVLLNDGSMVIIEIKRKDEMVNISNILKYNALKVFCEENGFGYTMIDKDYYSFEDICKIKIDKVKEKKFIDYVKNKKKITYEECKSFIRSNRIKYKELYKIILDNPNHLEYRQFNIYYKNRRYYE